MQTIDSKAFNNAVLPAWDDAMDRFFTEVEQASKRAGLDPEQTRQMLDKGYGYEVGDAWLDWTEGA